MRTIFLLDIDCFFASVEMALQPDLRGKPVCVGGLRGERGIVSCPNYEARAYGVRTAMPLRTAERLLPREAVFLRGNHRLYGDYSDRVMDILHDFTPDIEQVSIDEAYMDVTGCLHFWGYNPVCMAAAMKERILKECGLTVSIGIASNKLCAKIAAGLRKPDGLLLVPHGGEREFLAPLPVEMVPGVGVKTAPKMHAQGIFIVNDILKQDPLQQSHIGRYLTAVLTGGVVMQSHRVEHSISRDTTFASDARDRGFISATLYSLTERCCKTLRKRKQAAATVTVKVRFANFTTVQKQTTLAVATANEEDVFMTASALLCDLLPAGPLVRLVGVKVSRLSAAGEPGSQMELGVTRAEKFGELHRRLDALQMKHGYTSIRWGITYTLERVKASEVSR